MDQIITIYKQKTQIMIIIGADLSLSSSAISILKEGELILLNYTNKKPSYKWIKNSTHLINYTFHKFDNSDEYTESEVDKLKKYGEITENIKNDILNIIEGEEEINIYIEGYAFSANGKLIDIITFSTLLRYKLLKLPNVHLFFIPPSSLKSFIGGEVYEKDKKGVYRNENGKASGSFDKKDMMEALLRLNLDFEYINYISGNKNILFETKDIPKPFDDINDSVILMYYGMKENNII